MRDAEEWRSVAGYDGLYDVSNLGRVRSLRFNNRSIDHLRKIPLIMKARNRKGYWVINLRKRAVTASPTVHELVLTAFVGPRPRGMYGAHLNGNPLDPHLTNLAWVTPTDNQSHRLAHGTNMHGERCPTSKLTVENALYIRDSTEHWTALSRRFGVVQATIWCVRTGRTWSRAIEEFEAQARCESANA